MIYDCFIINDELEICKFRLDYLYAHVDKFIIVESTHTFTGIRKKLHFQENLDLFKRYEGKIIHLVFDEVPHSNAWENEWQNRNYIKQGLIDANPEDTVYISDVDEIINIELISKYQIDTPLIIPMYMSYYYSNVIMTGVIWEFCLVSPYKIIKNVSIGNRIDYRKFSQNLPNQNVAQNGIHISYLFGLEYEKYKLKIESFSHTEYNNPFYKNKLRLYSCIICNKDLFHRPIKFNEKDEYNQTIDHPFISKHSKPKISLFNNFFWLIIYLSFDYFLKIRRKIKLIATFIPVTSYYFYVLT